MLFTKFLILVSGLELDSHIIFELSPHYMSKYNKPLTQPPSTDWS